MVNILMGGKILKFTNFTKVSNFRKVVVTLPLAICILLFITCGKKENSNSNKSVFIYNQINPITSLDPAFARNQSNMWGIETLFDCLVDVDDSLHIVPSLAKSWTISPDGMHYTFLLRNNVFFHDNACFPNGKGRKLVASDVGYSLNRIIDSGVVNSPGSWIFK